jgi:hypothetical protein
MIGLQNLKKVYRMNFRLLTYQLLLYSRGNCRNSGDYTQRRWSSRHTVHILYIRAAGAPLVQFSPCFPFLLLIQSLLVFNVRK